MKSPWNLVYNGQLKQPVREANWCEQRIISVSHSNLVQKNKIINIRHENTWCMIESCGPKQIVWNNCRFSDHETMNIKSGIKKDKNGNMKTKWKRNCKRRNNSKGRWQMKTELKETNKEFSCRSNIDCGRILIKNFTDW